MESLAGSGNWSHDEFADEETASPALTEERSSAARPGIDWRKLIVGNGGSLLYLVSALCLLAGLGQIIGPILAESHDTVKLFPSLGTLYLYELCLLAAALFIVRCKNVTDDAVVLLVLIAVFMGIGGLALETVASDDNGLALACGLLLLGAGAGKLWAIKRWLAPQLNRVVLGVVFVILACGYLGPVAFASFNVDRDELALRPGWLAGWWILALACAALYVTAEVLPRGDARRAGSGGGDSGDGGAEAAEVPFALTPGMGWVFVAVLLAMAVLHQMGLAHLAGNGEDPDGFPWSWFDLLPIAIFAVLLAVQYRRLFGCEWGRLDEVLMALPALGIAGSLQAGGVAGLPGLDWELLRHPAALSALICAAIGLKAWHTRRDLPWVMTIGYAALVALSFCPAAGGGVTGGCVLAAGIVLLFGLVVMVALTRKIEWAVAAAAFVGPAVFLSPIARETASVSWMFPVGLATIAQGVALWLVQLAFRRRCPRFLARLAPLMLLVGVASLFGVRNPAVDVALLVLATAGMGVLAWIRGGERMAALMYAGVPAWQGVQLMRASFGWGCVGLGFLLLAAGVVYSLRKGRHPALAGLPENR